MTITAGDDSVGILVRRWRERRRRSQLDVSIAAGVSTRHLSYIETGRSMPSRTMIERLCDELDVPLRERNAFHLAAGLAPAHRERPWTDLGAVRHAIDAVLTGSEPHPAVAVDVHWDLLAANRPATALLATVPEPLTGPPLNMLRATLHPGGLAPRLRNHARWRAHTLRRVRRQLDRTGDPALADLLAELESYPVPQAGPHDGGADDDVVVPMRLATDAGDLALLYAVTVFGSPRDVTLDEIAIETFFPADDATRAVLQRLAAL